MESSDGDKPKDTHLIKFQGVSKETLDEFACVLNGVVLLCEKLRTKTVKIREWSDELKNLSSGEEKRSIEGHKKLSESVCLYIELLERVFKELSAEVVFFSQYVRDNPPENIEVSGNGQALTAAQIIEFKTVSLKKNAKAIHRDLQVSFSRYEYGLGGQIKSLKLANGKQYR